MQRRSLVFKIIPDTPVVFLLNIKKLDTYAVAKIKDFWHEGLPRTKYAFKQHNPGQSFRSFKTKGLEEGSWRFKTDSHVPIST